jgi:predicted dehydrogenase
MDRRRFISESAAASIAFAAAPYILARSNKTYRIALIGAGWWGMNILREALAAGRSSVVALCDADARTLTTAGDEVNDLSGATPKTYQDFRELLDKEKPEIVIVATPDHWHALPTVAALKSGTHVFVEKPTGHTVAESQAIVKAAHESGRVVQVGLHRRIGPHHVSGMKFLKSGGAGKVGLVRMFVTGGGGPEKPTPNADPPKKLNWDLYCGPAPLRPFNSKIHPGGWRNFLDFGNGTLGDWGVHWIDQALWWADDPSPKHIYSTGGRPVRGPAILTAKEQTTDAPDSQVVVYDFDSFTCIWEHRQFAPNDGDKHKIGCYFHGTKGTFHMGWRDGWTFYPSNGREKVIHEDAQLQEPDGHNLKLLWADFLKAIDSGSAPVAGVERGHRATTAAWLGMVSLKLGRSISWDGSKEMVPGDDAANALLRREYRAPWVLPG